ncbi:MAG: MotA/TolQ/ExbB proton channel family protein [Bacteroidia bacterium]|nr:MotA/TolQ/ExbB proton channel family protein [Bacteroidia bacterium]
MKKFLTLCVIAVLFCGFSTLSHAQDDAEANQDMVEDTAIASDETVMEEEVVAEELVQEEAVEETPPPAETEEEEDATFHQVIKTKFIEGGPGFMGIVLICLILGLAIAIERIIYLNLASTNTKKLLVDIETSIQSGGVDAAKEVCRNTSGPVASIFYQGLSRSHEGVDIVEKSIISYGSVQMGLLERGMVWLSLFISLAPMLGFMGTVIGMIQAFDAIAIAGDISPAIVADGIKVALLTTVAGLIVAVILQVFYNYIVTKIDGIVNSMEDASISLVDVLVKHNLTNN